MEMNDGKLNIKGEKTWSISYTSTDTSFLFSDFPQGLTLDQSFKVDMKGYITDSLGVVAHFDDHAPNSQHLTLTFKKDSFEALFGDFTAKVGSNNPFISYEKRVKGMGLRWENGKNSTKLFASVEEGEPHSKTFYGTTSTATVTFSLNDETGRKMPYEGNIKGLYYLTLSSTYIAGITYIALRFTEGTSFESCLEKHGLGFLFDFISNEPTVSLPISSYDVLNGKELLFKWIPSTILRMILKNLIQQYNVQNGTDEEYPLDETKDSGFLNEILSKYSSLLVGDVKYPADPSAYNRGRFYYLGRGDILRDTISATVVINGNAYPVDALPELDARVYEDKGYISFSSCLYDNTHFGEDLSDDMIEVSFKYTRSSSIFFLGLNVISGSEHVYLNSIPLKRDIDYKIDCETGTLVILIPLLETDVIKVDYETARRGMGSQNYYNRLVAGGSSAFQFDFNNIHLENEISGIYSSDLAPSIDPTVPIMPNTYLILGLGGKLKWNALNIEYAWSGNYDVFPEEKGKKPYASNSITAMSAAKDLIFFATKSGLTIHNTTPSSTEWASINAADGLPSNNINTVAATDDFVFVGTNYGMAFIDLSTFTPDSTDWQAFFQKNIFGDSNWKIIRKENGLPGDEIKAISFFGNTLYLGTGNGIAVISLTKLKRFTGKEKLGFSPYLNDEMNPFDVEKLAIKDDNSMYLIHNGQVYLLSNKIDLYSVNCGDATVNTVKSLNEGIFVGTTKGLVKITDGSTTLVYPDVNVLDVVNYEETRLIVTDKDVHFNGKKYLVDKGITVAKVVGNDIWFGARRGIVYHTLNGIEFSNSITGIPDEDKSRYEELEPNATNTDIGQAFKGMISFPIGNWKVNGNIYYADDSYHAVQNKIKKGNLNFAAFTEGKLWNLGELRISSSYSQKISSNTKTWKGRITLYPNSNTFYIPDILDYGFVTEIPTNSSISLTTIHNFKSEFKNGSSINLSFNTRDKKMYMHSILNYSNALGPFACSMKYDKSLICDTNSSMITRNDDELDISSSMKTDSLDISYSYSLNCDEMKTISYMTHLLEMSSTFIPKSKIVFQGKLNKDEREIYNLDVNGNLTSSLVAIPFFRRLTLSADYATSSASWTAPHIILNMESNSVEDIFGFKTTLNCTYGWNTYIYGSEENVKAAYALNMGVSKKLWETVTVFLRGRYRYEERHSSSKNSTSTSLTLQPSASMPIFPGGKLELHYDLGYTNENAGSAERLENRLTADLKYEYGENWVFELEGYGTYNIDLNRLSNPPYEFYKITLKANLNF